MRADWHDWTGSIWKIHRRILLRTYASTPTHSQFYIRSLNFAFSDFVICCLAPCFWFGFFSFDTSTPLPALRLHFRNHFSFTRCVCVQLFGFSLLALIGIHFIPHRKGWKQAHFDWTLICMKPNAHSFSFHQWKFISKLQSDLSIFVYLPVWFDAFLASCNSCAFYLNGVFFKVKFFI